MKKILAISTEGPEFDLVEGILKVLADFKAEQHADIKTFFYAMDIMKLFDKYLDTIANNDSK